MGHRVTKLLTSLPLMIGGRYDKIFAGPLVSIPVAKALFPPKFELSTAAPPLEELRLLSWNLLATPYVRPRGSESEHASLERLQQQLALVADADADVIGLQEFWCTSPHLVEKWQTFAAKHGYIMHVCRRVDGKLDGCAMLVRASICDEPPQFTAYTYGDWGSRVLQVCTLRGLTLLQTHLTFPHESEHDPVMRYHQARKIAELTREMNAPTVLFGDLNGDPTDPAVQTLTTLGGLRAHPPLPGVADGASWVSHVAHTGALMQCDLVLTRGACRVRDWRLGGTHEQLVSRTWLSDHRPLIATLQVGEAAVVATAAEEDAAAGLAVDVS